MLQLLRRTSISKPQTTLLLVLSICCISTSAFMSYLFPVVKLNIQKGTYDVGVTDIFLPVEEQIKIDQILNNNNNDDDNKNDMILNSNVNVRILYPTKRISSSLSTTATTHGMSISIRKRLSNKLKRIKRRISSNGESNNRIPYFSNDIAKAYLSQLIKLAPIKLVKSFTWILYYMRLITLPISTNSIPINNLDNDKNKKLPIVIFSHGLFGSCHLYSYQGYALASEGKVVVMVNHLDGSAPVAKKDDTGSSSSLLPLDTSIFNLYREKKTDEATEIRRMQTNFRSNEILSALISLLRINEGDYNYISTDKNNNNVLNVLQNKLDINDITLIGHSFGGASVLSAATKYPELIKNVIVQDPVIDWLPESMRRSLLSESRLLNSGVSYNGGSTGWKKKQNALVEKKSSYNLLNGEEKKEPSEFLRRLPSSSLNDKSIHDVNLFFIYCEEWHEKNWGNSEIIKKMYTKGQLGNNSLSKSNNSNYDTIKDSKHQHFSDVNLITPNWLNKKIGLTGNRCSYDILDELMNKMLCFMDKD